MSILEQTSIKFWRAINFTSKLKKSANWRQQKWLCTSSKSFSCLTYLALFNGSPFAFIWTSSVLGHGVPLSKWLYTKCRSSCSGLSKIQTLLLFLNLLQYFNICLIDFYPALFNYKWLWLAKRHFLNNRSFTKTSLPMIIAHCLFNRIRPWL